LRLRARQLPSAVLLAGILAVPGLAGCGSSSQKTSSVTTPHNGPTSAPARPGVGKPAVTLGTKNFTEQLVLGQLYAQALRAKGYKITLKSNLGASEVVDRELTSGRIDGYPEYTGTVLSVLAHDPKRPRSAAEAYARAAAFERKRDVVLLTMAPAEDKDVLITKPAFAARHGLHALSDLVRMGRITLAAPPEFKTRFNGLIGLREAYGVRTIRFMPVKIGQRYQVLQQGKAQVVAGFTTDGNLSRGGYTLLSDPRNIFGFQNVTFLIRGKTLAREGPAFGRTVDAVSADLSTQALRVMNAAVDLDQQSPSAVARQFLQANGLL
jgi:osmoprotectant transport system substrate-binding protein